MWVRPHLPAMRRYAVLIGTKRDRDDVVQDALERAWRRWETYRADRGSARTWLLAIVADQSRRRRLRAPRLQLVELDAGLPAAQVGVSPAERIDVQAAITRLPRRQRQAVLLFYFVDLSVAETAAAMGCAEGTVKSALSDARARLGLLLGGTDERYR